MEHVGCWPVAGSLLRRRGLALKCGGEYAVMMHRILNLDGDCGVLVAVSPGVPPQSTWGRFRLRSPSFTNPFHLAAAIGVLPSNGDLGPAGPRRAPGFV